MSRLQIGTIGWDFPAWEQGFYPDDIPDDWRLAYYANEFSAVVLPQSFWTGEKLVSTVDMLEGMDETFSVYCLAESAGLDDEQFLRAKNRLGVFFAGFIIERVVQIPDVQGLQTDDILLCLNGQVPEAFAGRYCADLTAITDRPLSVVNITETYSLRQLRQYFEVLKPMLVEQDRVLVMLSMPSPDIEYFQQLRTLVELMAIA